MRSFAPLVLASLLAACSPGGEAADGTRRMSGERTSPTASPPVVVEGAPAARLQAGTDSVSGALIRLCDGTDCRASEAPAPRALKLPDNELLLFAISTEPETARAELRELGGDELLERIALQPGTLMGFTPRPSRGRYDLRLIARWGERKAVWRFELLVPRRD